MFKVTILFATLALAAAVDNNSTCGADSPSSVPDCDHNDLGSCGNACCAIEFELPLSVKAAYTAGKGFLTTKGTDGSYTYNTGKDAAGHNPGDDLTQYHIPGGWSYIFHGTHTT